MEKASVETPYVTHKVAKVHEVVIGRRSFKLRKLCKINDGFRREIKMYALFGKAIKIMLNSKSDQKVTADFSLNSMCMVASRINSPGVNHVRVDSVMSIPSTYKVISWGFENLVIKLGPVLINQSQTDHLFPRSLKGSHLTVDCNDKIFLGSIKGVCFKRRRNSSNSIR